MISTEDSVKCTNKQKHKIRFGEQHKEVEHLPACYMCMLYLTEESGSEVDVRAARVKFCLFFTFSNVVLPRSLTECSTSSIYYTWK